MRKIMYNTCALFILKLRVVVCSVLFILHPPDKRVTICVDTASYHQVTCVVCKHDRKCRSGEYGYVIHVLILLLFILTQFYECQATVQRVIVPPLRFIAISSFIKCYLFYVHMKKLF
jgi:hypothetical protein